MMDGEIRYPAVPVGFNDCKIIIDTSLLGIVARAFLIIFGRGSAVGTAFGKRDLKDDFGFKKILTSGLGAASQQGGE